MNPTVTILGNNDKISKALVSKLISYQYPLVVITRKEDYVLDMGLINSQNDIRYIQCAEEGCWEGDIILIINDNKPFEKSFLKTIIPYCNQKDVLFISENKKTDNIESNKMQELNSEFQNANLYTFYLNQKEHLENQKQIHSIEVTNLIQNINT